ncbi:hypothetical protein CR194_17465 [Salipaludibacillus keqinensis]|uniref:Uncharacterized protein n=1 Tax=Salipaludibacillus keqinensis TaxID=2045207 RepID=A0A323TAH8_9BACI|nr:hypothetical protein [Salipaludibacillus keqinensis]PYZ91986.1 hypothetical protein CR194_17465 [Salipaludibacillus keqinensis]
MKLDWKTIAFLILGRRLEDKLNEDNFHEYNLGGNVSDDRAEHKPKRSSQHAWCILFGFFVFHFSLSNERGAFMQYLIDHEKKSIHRTTYANDRCNFHKTDVKEREFTHNMGYIEKLKIVEKYKECEHCNLLSAKPI